MVAVAIEGCGCGLVRGSSGVCGICFGRRNGEREVKVSRRKRKAQWREHSHVITRGVCVQKK
jgi:hypothetical protein